VQVLLRSAAEGQPEAVRIQSLRTLASLAVDEQNRQPMWDDQSDGGVRHVLLRAAHDKTEGVWRQVTGAPCIHFLTLLLLRQRGRLPPP